MKGHLVHLYHVPALGIPVSKGDNRTNPVLPEGVEYTGCERYVRHPMPVRPDDLLVVPDDRMPDWGDDKLVLSLDGDRLQRADFPGPFFTGLFAGTSDTRFGERFKVPALPVFSGVDMGFSLDDIDPGDGLGLVVRPLDGRDCTSGRPDWRGVSAMYDVLSFAPDGQLEQGRAGKRDHLRDARCPARQMPMFGGNFLLTKGTLVHIHDRLE